jgi:hypothetical protein
MPVILSRQRYNMRKLYFESGSWRIHDQVQFHPCLISITSRRREENLFVNPSQLTAPDHTDKPTLLYSTIYPRHILVVSILTYLEKQWVLLAPTWIRTGEKS